MNKASSNTRKFSIRIRSELNPISQSPINSKNSIQLSNSTYFNSMNQIDAKLAVKLHDEIMDLIRSRAKAIQNFWFANVPHYFNRRAYGMKMSGIDLFDSRGHKVDKGLYKSNAKHEFFGEIFVEKPTENRESSGQLRSALEITSLSSRGIEFYVKDCTNPRDGTEYVSILVEGRGPVVGSPYVPQWDARVKNPYKTWNGISSNYWAVWQQDFMIFLEEKEYELNYQIRELLTHHKVIPSNVSIGPTGNITQKKLTYIENQIIVPNSPYGNTDYPPKNTRKK